MTDNQNEPFWKRPLPPITRLPVDDPLELTEDDPLAAPGKASAIGDGAAITSKKEVHPVAESLDNFESPHANGSAPSHIDAPKAALSVVAAHHQLAEAQMRCARATDRQREARGNVAVALEKFQRATMVTQNFEQLIRQHIDSENKLRADRVAGNLPQRGAQRRLGSAVDAYAFHTRNHGRGAGGGNAFRRGAHPAARRTPK